MIDKSEKKRKDLKMKINEREQICLFYAFENTSNEI